MFPLLIRSIIMYVIVILGVRFMGKRQIGELQPAELVITILMSDIASMPLQNSEVALVQPLMTIMLLIALELLSSVVSMKSRKFRTALQGHSIMVIKDGEIDQAKMKQIRYSVDDIMEALRLKDVFDISDVSYAYVETNGSLSVLLKDDVKGGKNNSPAPIPCLVISDGKVVEREFELCGLSKKKLETIVRKKGLETKDIFLMTYASDGNSNIIVRKVNT